MRKNTNKKIINYYRLLFCVSSVIATLTMCGCENDSTETNIYEEYDKNIDMENMYVLINKDNNYILCYKDIVSEELNLIETDIYSKVMGFYYPVFDYVYGYYSLDSNELIFIEGQEKEYGYKAYEINEETKSKYSKETRSLTR